MLTERQAQIAAEAVAAVESAATRAEALAEEKSSSVWTWISGADSTAAAMKSDAHSTRAIATQMRERLPSLVATGDAAALGRFLELGAAGADLSMLEATAKQLGAGAFTDQVIVQSAKDGASSAGGALLWIGNHAGLIAAIALAVVLWPVLSAGAGLFRRK